MSDEAPDVQHVPPPDDAQELHFCGVTMAMQAGIGPWQKRSLTWSIHDLNLPQLGLEATRQAFAEAFGNWASVCGLQFTETTGTAADIVITAGAIDGPMGVLAWSELPNGNDRPLKQRYDQSERFIVSIHPTGNTIDLVAVACHEIGHAIGLEHAAQGGPDLMAPVYSPGRRTPQSGDVARVLDFYGPPVTAPPPDGGRKSTWMVILDQYEQQLARFHLEQTA